MPLNYLELLKKHSNSQLLKIIKQPDTHQADAINAAKQILAERNVSEEEIEAVDIELYHKETEKEIRAETAAALREEISKRVEHFVNPLNHSNKKLSIRYWLWAFIIIQIGLYLWALPGYIRYLKFSIHFDGSFLELLFIVLYFAQFIYTPLFCYLLIKRKKAGWMLFLFNVIFSIFAGIISISQQINNRDLYSELFNYNSWYDVPIYLLGIAYNVFAMFFLLRTDVQLFFNISDEVKKSTIILSLLITLAFFLLLYLQ